MSAVRIGDVFETSGDSFKVTRFCEEPNGGLAVLKTETPDGWGPSIAVPIDLLDAFRRLLAIEARAADLLKEADHEIEKTRGTPLAWSLH